MDADELIPQSPDLPKRCDSQSEEDIEFLHRDIRIEGNQMMSAQCQVYFCKFGKMEEHMVLKMVSQPENEFAFIKIIVAYLDCLCCSVV